MDATQNFLIASDVLSPMRTILCFLLFGIGLVSLNGQVFLSLENAGRFKRIQIHPGDQIMMQRNGDTAPFGGELLGIRNDSVFFYGGGLTLDSIQTVWLPPKPGTKYAFYMFKTAAVNAFVIFSLIWLVNELPHDGFQKGPFIRTMIIDGASLGIFFLPKKILLRKYKLEKNWQLKVMEVPVLGN